MSVGGPDCWLLKRERLRMMSRARPVEALAQAAPDPERDEQHRQQSADGDRDVATPQRRQPENGEAARNPDADQPGPARDGRVPEKALHAVDAGADLGPRDVSRRQCVGLDALTDVA